MNGNSYRLYINPRSPFARRIRLAMRRLGLSVEEMAVDAFQAPAELNAANPLGLLPTLVTPDVGPISDSANILEYLHEKSGQIWPSDFNRRSHVRQASVLAAGIMQSSILYFQEVKMHEAPSPRWANEHVTVIEETLEYIVSSPHEWWFENGTLTQAGWDLVVALEYSTLRLLEIDWASKYPVLVELHAHAQKDSFFVESTPRI